jgi:hypothetical protein
VKPMRVLAWQMTQAPLVTGEDKGVLKYGPAAFVEVYWLDTKFKSHYTQVAAGTPLPRFITVTIHGVIVTAFDRGAFEMRCDLSVSSRLKKRGKG